MARKYALIIAALVLGFCGQLTAQHLIKLGAGESLNMHIRAASLNEIIYSYGDQTELKKLFGDSLEVEYNSFNNSARFRMRGLQMIFENYEYPFGYSLTSLLINEPNHIVTIKDVQMRCGDNYSTVAKALDLTLNSTFPWIRYMPSSEDWEVMILFDEEAGTIKEISYQLIMQAIEDRD